MKTVFLSSVAAAVLLFTASCGTKPADSNTAAATTTAASTTTTPASTTPAAAAPATISFVAKALSEDKDNDTPYAEIYFSYVSATKKAEIIIAPKAMGAYNPVDKAQFADFKIPAEAAAAVSGFWAGLGTAYYAIEKDGKVLIFEGFQDEGMPEYTYKEVKSFDPNKLVY
jgi:predicted small lipoprotein YifL